jgi:hypothetical protein
MGSRICVVFSTFNDFSALENDDFAVSRLCDLDHILEIEVPIKSEPVLLPESPAPISVPIPRHPNEVGADIIQSSLWLLVGTKRSCDQEF